MARTPAPKRRADPALDKARAMQAARNADARKAEAAKVKPSMLDNFASLGASLKRGADRMVAQRKVIADDPPKRSR